MNSIVITENPNEMIALGKELYREKQDKYNDTLMGIIRGFIRSRMKDASEQEIDDMVYITIYHYWVYGCTYEECLNYDFRNISHEKKLTYMTFRVRLQYMDHLSRAEDKHLLFNKYEAYQLLKDEFKREVILCSSEDDYPIFRDFTERHPEFVVKPTDMSGGRGVYKASIAGLDEVQQKLFFENLLQEGKKNQEKYLRGKENSVVLEELIDQAEEMAVFNPASVNGVRVPTVSVNGKIQVYQPWLKVGRGGHFLTSAVFGTIAAGIDAQTGVVDTPGMTEIGEIWDRHPDCGIPFVGFQIPQWDALVAMAKECAAKVPMFGYIGWDFVLAKDGWCVMEANYSGDFEWQLCRQKGMRREFEELIGWKMQKDFWWQ